MSMASPAASSACWTGCCSSASRPGRATGPRNPCAVPAPSSTSSSPPHGSSSRPPRRRSIAGHGPCPDGPRSDRSLRARVHAPARAHPDRAVANPRSLGLLAAHTRRAADPRAAGGSGLVDLTLPGVGRDPAWLTAIARASGLHIVMGCGWYRGAYYPAEAMIDRRSVDDLADELVAEATAGVGDSGVRPGIIG